MTKEEVAFLESVGGKQIKNRETKRALGLPVSKPAWNFGWIPPEERTRKQAAAHNAAVADMPAFNIVGHKTDDPKKVFLWDAWKDPRVVAATGGMIYPGVHQLTGSCVGAGGGNTVFSLAALEVVRLGDPEQALIPFWLIPYGRSRFYMGDRGRGEGSTGGAFAKAIKDDGVIPANTPGLPTFKTNDGLIWGSSVEMEWSDGDDIDERWLTESRKHTVKTTAEIGSADAGREAIRNGYPMTWCGNWGGLMKCPTQGEPAVLLNKRSGSWSHQQSCHGWWDHPTLGELFYIWNQWGLDAHGRDPAGGPAGGYWILKKEFEWQCRNGEVYAFSQFSGFPAQDLSWLI